MARATGRQPAPGTRNPEVSLIMIPCNCVNWLESRPGGAYVARHSKLLPFAASAARRKAGNRPDADADPRIAPQGAEAAIESPGTRRIRCPDQRRAHERICRRLCPAS